MASDAKGPFFNNTITELLSWCALRRCESLEWLARRCGVKGKESFHRWTINSPQLAARTSQPGASP